MGLAVSAATPAIEAGRFYIDTLLRWGASPQTLMTADIVEPLRIFEARSG
jgi:hypothetical protein